MKFALSVLFLFVFLTRSPGQEAGLKLWYEKPATRWTEALPIGNGRSGAMLYGGVTRDHIQFNEETLWTGEPRDHHREGAYQYLSRIRQLLEDNKQEEAEMLAEKHFMGKKSNEDQYEEQKRRWVLRVRSDTTPAAFAYNDAMWKSMRLPTRDGWEASGHDGLDGSVWFRTAFELPRELEGKDLTLNLGRIRDVDFTYVNGVRVGNSAGNDDREYIIGSSLLRPGANVIAVQVINFYDKGGFSGRRGGKKDFVVYADNGEGNALKLPAYWKYRVQDMEAPAFPRYQADYQPFGDLWLVFDHDSVVTNYRRELDVASAVSTVAYTSSGVNYKRSYFASAPHQAIVVNIKADRRGSISLQALLSSPHNLSSVRKIDENTLGLSLQVRNGALRGASRLFASLNGGRARVSWDGIHIEEADEVTFYLTSATNFVSYRSVDGNPETKSERPLKELHRAGYNKVLEAHIEDYQRYFNTVSLDVGTSAHQSLPTDERIARYTTATDPSLITLYFQYGRYLLISSSRPGTQPANLQGIWNDLLTPPWGSKYTTNINAEMNYWPAELLNLSDCHEPLFRLIEDVSQAGQKTAREHYNAQGWVLHHNTDLWRGTAPINASNHGIWVTGGAWMCQHLWEHFQFTQDLDFLRNRAYPIMKEAAKFFVDFLIHDPKTGWLISSPSNSPEQGGLVAGPAMDHQIVRALFSNCIAASKLLDTDETFRQKLVTLYNEIAPDQAGRHGQLQEWLEDRDDPDNRHRHVSHLWAVYPGSDINPDNTPALMEAARQSLIFRGDGGTGWSLAWKVNLWARLRDGDHTLLMVNKLLEPAITPSGDEKGGVYPNLFDAHPPFQIDGNLGGASGIAEMLVQSHLGYIDLLPALPSQLEQGSISGICARGAFELSIEWSEGKLKQVEVLSKAGKECWLKYGAKQIRLATKKGQRYRFDGNLVRII